MPDPIRETAMGGLQSGFCTTVWSDILKAGGPPTEESRRQLDALIRTYWKPVYAYMRSSWKLSVEDAKDLTQAFFMRFLEKDYWARARPERGSFRGYLKRAVKNFLINAKRDVKPEHVGFSMDMRDVPTAAPDESPESAYDREWLATVIDESFADLHEFLTQAGKGHYSEIFKSYCFAENDSAGGTPTYDELAARFELRKHDVRNILSYCRKTFRETVKRRVRQYVDSDEALEAELADILRAW
jgi:RNA polymerase sigma factor (sigma-70 family)